MKQQELLSADNEVLYFWDITEKGVHFEYESLGTPGSAFSMDSEIQFTMPISEFHKVYEMFSISTSLDIAEAIHAISGSGRGEAFYDALGTEIEVIDKFVWMN